MLVFCDIVTGDEMVTDAYRMDLQDDCFYYIKGELRQYKSDDIDDSAIGGNKSAEAEDDTGGAVDTNTLTQIDVVRDNRLTEVFFADKKDYIKRNLKPFLAAIKKRKIECGELCAHDEGEHKKWEGNIQALVKKHILSEFSNLQFFAGENGDDEGHVACVNYIDNKPVLMLFKEGLREVKQ